MLKVLERVVGEVDAGRAVALGVVVGRRGSAPQQPGALLCVDEAARITGTVGGGCVEADVRRRAHELLSRRAGADRGTGEAGGAPEAVRTLDLDHDFGFDDGLICGGQMDIAVVVYAGGAEVEPVRQAVARLRAGESTTLPIRVTTTEGVVEYRVKLEPAPKLVIAGAGHLGKALAELAVRLGFAISVIDDRADYANAERFPSPIEPVVGDIAQTLCGWLIDANTYVVVVTRGHQHDEQALGAVLSSSAKYLGMVGSKRKIQVIYDDLRQAGATDAQLERVHAPIGLPISALTPEEIAVSIAAELISVRRVEHRKMVEGPFPVAADTP